jgi:SAM-dependent methyltransferase
LTLLGDRLFDLIYTDLVLQHLPPDISVRYIAEFLRVLSPEGVLVFQLPSHRRSRRSSEVIAMPASTYRARIEVIETPPHWQRGEKASIVVRVTNISNEAWNQTTSGAIRLGNHWLSPRGAMLIQDDGRTALPLTIEAGGSVTTTIDVNVPPEPGEHLLELDLVHEGLSWFADKGSSTTRFQVGEPPSGTELERARTIAAPASWDESLLRPFLLPVSAEDATFPMHGVPRQDVEAIVLAHGGRLVLAESDDRGGPEWEGFRYFVRK